MITKLMILVSVFFIVQSTSLYSLVDEVHKQLDQLAKIVQDNILEASSQLSKHQVDFLTSSDRIASDGILSIQQQYEKITENIAALKARGDSANVDVTSCVDRQQAQIATSANEYIELLQNCTSGVNQEQARLTYAAQYIIDVIFNKVRDLAFHVGNCKEELLCLQPLLIEIELDKIRLPQNIAMEVNVHERQLQILKISVQDCTDRNFVGYTDDSNALYNVMVSCVNNLLN